MTSDKSELVLANENVKAVFDRDTGTLIGLENKRTGWSIQRRRELALSFRLLVPMPDRRNNPVHGETQKPASIEEDAEGNRIVFTWKNLRSKHGGVLDIVFKGIVTLTDDGLAFEAEIENRSPYVVEAVDWPAIGDFTRPDGAERLEKVAGVYSQMSRSQIYPFFTATGGYYGVDYPIITALTPDPPFVLTETGAEGLYAGYHDASLEQMVQYTWEWKPGYEYHESCQRGYPPREDEISGQPVRMEFYVTHFPYVAAGESGVLHPLVLAPYTGTWHYGADVYKRWRKTWFKRPPAPDWIDEVHAWQQIHINSPEDELRCRYEDLVKYGEDCAKHGVAAIQLTGWTIWGQDRGNPSHDVDPRLGTADDLREAIAKIHEMGVRVILFNKFTWADRSDKLFHSRFKRYAVKDPYGDYDMHSGYAYQTPTQLAGLNLHRLVVMCHACKEWREIAHTEFKKALSLGSAGMLYDECQHHAGTHYCFAPDHGHRVPAHVYAGDSPLAEELREIAQQMRPDYLFAGEACYDHQFLNYSLSYFRMDSALITPLQRYLDPEAQMMVAIVGHNDRNSVNQALMYRYIMSYEPRSFKGRLDEYPLTIEYGKKVDALRKRYSEYLWTAEYRDTVGAEVTADGKPTGTYSVFENHTTGKRAVVVSNLERDAAAAARVVLDGPSGPLVVATPEEPDERDTDGTVKIPPRSVVVIMEK